MRWWPPWAFSRGSRASGENVRVQDAPTQGLCYRVTKGAPCLTSASHRGNPPSEERASYPRSGTLY